MGVEPVPGAAAAVVDLPGERALAVADYHAGLEEALRYEGVELRSRAAERREHLLDLLAETEADRLVVLGDLSHAIGEGGREERAEVEALLEAVTARVPVTVVKGNHDGDLERVLAGRDLDVRVTPTDGIRAGGVGLVHGHTWPRREVLEADVVCVGHEHPMVRLEDTVGASRIERVWLRGRLDAAPFRERHPDLEAGGDLVVFPAFNDLTGGTWVNVGGQEFLSPFLPEALADAEAYLLDGTRLGGYRGV